MSEELRLKSVQSSGCAPTCWKGIKSIFRPILLPHQDSYSCLIRFLFEIHSYIILFYLNSDSHCKKGLFHLLCKLLIYFGILYGLLYCYLDYHVKKRLTRLMVTVNRQTVVAMVMVILVISWTVIVIQMCYVINRCQVIRTLMTRLKQVSSTIY